MTSLGYSFSYVIGFMWSGIWYLNYNSENDENFEEGKTKLLTLSISQAIFISLVCILNFIFIKEKPISPPSFTATVKKENMRDAIK